MFLGFLKMVDTHLIAPLMVRVRVRMKMNAAIVSILVPKFRKLKNW